jgi:hypothetical protein
MARSDEQEIRALEEEALHLGLSVALRSYEIREVELGDQFRWIRSELIQESMSAKTPTQFERK